MLIHVISSLKNSFVQHFPLKDSYLPKDKGLIHRCENYTHWCSLEDHRKSPHCINMCCQSCSFLLFPKETSKLRENNVANTSLLAIRNWLVCKKNRYQNVARCLKLRELYDEKKNDFRGGESFYSY